MSESISVYMVVNLNNNDRDEYRIYEKGFFPFLKKYNGTFITFDDSPVCLEGETPKQFDRVIYFPFHQRQMQIIGGLMRGIKSLVNIEEMLLI